MLNFCSLILVTACTSSNPSQSQLAEPILLDQASLMKAVQEAEKPYTVVNFYATHCKPCEMEIPELLRMVESGHPEVAMIFVALDEVEGFLPKYQTMLSRMKVSFPAYQYTLSEAEAFILGHHEDWGGDIPLNLIFRQDGTMIHALGMTDPQELKMLIHRDQSFRD